MKTLGIICEFNPFHNGHAYLIKTAKEKTGCNAVIAVMSGNFTQRGLPAVTDKALRAKTAVEHGVDLVLELPAAFAVQSAQYFAQSGVNVLEACEIVDVLAFGSECGTLAPLQAALNISQSSEFSNRVRAQKNRSLASALALSADTPALFTPNNTLGIEYLRALQSCNSRMLPFTCRRVGVEHDATKTHHGYASASYLRNALYAGREISSYAPFTPKSTASLQQWETLVLYRLRTMSPTELQNICGVSEGIENRILAAAKKADSYENLIARIKTKRYTRTHIERIFTNAVLGITTDLLSHPPYLRVLAANNTGIALIREIQKRHPVIVKTADCQHPLLSVECRADDIYALLLNDKSGGKTFTSPHITKEAF